MSKNKYKFKTALVDIEKDGITWVTFNQPEKRNCITPEMSREMGILLDQLAEDKEVRVVIFTGAGPAWCAGMDIKTFYETRDLPARDWSGESTMMYGKKPFDSKLRELPQPTIAAVNGYVYGRGLHVLCMCDIAVASDKALMGLSEVNFGRPPGGACTRAVLERVGQKWGSWIALTGMNITGAQAAEIGLVNFCVPHDQLRDEAHKIARLLVAHHPIALEFIKLQIRMAMDAPGNEMVGEYLDHSIQIRMRTDTGHTGHHDGYKAFIDKKYRPGVEAWNVEKGEKAEGYV